MKYGYVFGNGLLRLPTARNESGGTFSWDELLDDLALHLKSEIRPSVPLPLEFDCLATKLIRYRDKYEILFKSLGYDDSFRKILETDDPLLGIKRYVAGKFNEKTELSVSHVFESMMQPISDVSPTVIITTNYDCRLEKQLKSDFHLGELVSFESTESFEPTLSYKGTDWYHCHGTIEAPATICLGHSDYARNIAFIDRTFDCLDAGCIDIFAPVWPLRFLDTNLAIVGLTLDYSEADLWHVLVKRAQYYAIHQCGAENVITYIDAAPRSNRANDPTMLMRKQQLRDLGVKVVNVSGPDYESCYEHAIGVIQDEWTGLWQY